MRLDWIEALENCPCIPIDPALVRQGAGIAIRLRAVLLGQRHARRGLAVLGASSTLSTKPSTGDHATGSVRVVNPFRAN